MRIYAKNIPVKCYPDPIWNDGALGFLKTSSREYLSRFYISILIFKNAILICVF